MSFKRIALAALIAGGALLGGCVTHVHEYDYEPPSQADNGYRHRYHGVDYVYDSQVGVYLIPGYAHHYWHGGSYYRYWGDRWERCGSLRGPWRSVDYYYVPQRLIVHRYPRGRHYQYNPQDYDRFRGGSDRNHADRDHYERSNVVVPNHPKDGKHVDVPGRDLVYEKDAEAYRVKGSHNDGYYKDGKFYRRDEDGWEKSQHRDRGYEDVRGRAVPQDIKHYENDQERAEQRERRDAQHQQQQQVQRQQEPQQQEVQQDQPKERRERKDKSDEEEEKDRQRRNRER